MFKLLSNFETYNDKDDVFYAYIIVLTIQHFEEELLAQNIIWSQLINSMCIYFSYELEN